MKNFFAAALLSAAIFAAGPTVFYFASQRGERPPHPARVRRSR